MAMEIAFAEASVWKALVGWNWNTDTAMNELAMKGCHLLHTATLNKLYIQNGFPLIVYIYNMYTLEKQHGTLKNGHIDQVIVLGNHHVTSGVYTMIQ